MTSFCIPSVTWTGLRNTLLLAITVPSINVLFASSLLCPLPTGVSPIRSRARVAKEKNWMAKNDGDIDLKAELTAYLKKRDEMGADEAAKKEVGKVVGGTQGNPILEYVSAAPKEIVIEEAPLIFDYGELAKYGFGHLATPIMEAGGRWAMYELMGLPPPPVPERSKPKVARRPVIDETGESDQSRYSGLKMNQVLDDDEMGRALEEARRKQLEGERLGPKLAEEDYVQPFADKRNTSPKQTPNWTPEQLDEEGRKRGQALSWARKVRAGEYRRDPYESMAVEGHLRWYCTFAALLTSFAFGKASPAALSMLGWSEEAARGLVDVVQGPALAVVLAGIGSGVLAGALLAPGKKRNPFVWGVKGFAGGPLAVLQLQALDELEKRGEE